MREEKPAEYVKVVASLLPKELLVRKDPLEDVSDEKLAEMIEWLDGAIEQGDGAPRPTHRGSGKA